MLVTVEGMEKLELFRPAQLAKAWEPMLVMPEGRVRLERTVQPTNILSPMAVIVEGAVNVTVARLVHEANIWVPRLVTLAGIVMLVRPVQPWNAAVPMLVTLEGMVTPVRPVHPLLNLV